MACSCGKGRRLPKVQPGSVPAGVRSHVFFYAVPPDGVAGDAVRFDSLREARWFAQRQQGPGWLIEGRRERVEG